MLSSNDLDKVLDEVARGNKEAFLWIVRAYSLPLRSYIGSQVHHLDETDDLAQEVFIDVYRNLHLFRRGEDFGAWIRGIARNKLNFHFRSLARRNRAIDRFREEFALTVRGDLERAVAADRTELVEMMLHCIAKLPEKLRKVVRAGLDGGSAGGLAQELETSVGAVYNLHYRANQLLRECVRKQFDPLVEGP